MTAPAWSHKEWCNATEGSFPCNCGAEPLGVLDEWKTHAHDAHEIKQAEVIADLLWDYLKRDPEHRDRRRIGDGTKTKLGLLRTIKERLNVKQRMGRCPSCGRLAPLNGQCSNCGHVEGDKSQMEALP